MGPDAPAILTRAVAYIRVSQARDGMISPELQQQAIDDYCRQRGYQLASTLEDLDLSGRFWKRRQVERAIAMIERGEAEVIVVWRWSRVTRARLDWAVAVDRVEAAGGRLESATEAFDTSTSVGKLARGILAEIAAFESDRLGDTWRETRERRIRLGLTSHGHAQFGYRKQQSGQYVRDRRTGPVLAELYQRYADGASFRSLVRWLNAQGSRTAAPTRPGTGWSLATLQRTLDSGFGAGYVRDLGQLVPGAQKPVISSELWQAYRTRRAATSWRRPTEFDDFLLAGLVHCGCGARMRTMRESGPWSRYRCERHPTRRAGLTITQRRLEGLVQQWLIALVDDPAVCAAALTAMQRYTEQRRVEAEGIRRGLAGATGERRGELAAALERVRSESSRPAPPTLARALAEDWDVLTVSQRKMRLTALVDRVVVHNDLPNPLIELHTTWGTVVPYSGTGHHRPMATTALSTRPDTTVDVPLENGADPLQLLSPGEAARIVGIQQQSLRAWDDKGYLPHTQWAPDGRSHLYAIQDLRKMRPRFRPTGGS